MQHSSETWLHMRFHLATWIDSFTSEKTYSLFFSQITHLVTEGIWSKPLVDWSQIWSQSLKRLLQCSFLRLIGQLKLPWHFAPCKLAAIVVDAPRAAKRVGAAASFLIFALTGTRFPASDKITKNIDAPGNWIFFSQTQCLGQSKLNKISSGKVLYDSYENRLTIHSSHISGKLENHTSEGHPSTDCTAALSELQTAPPTGLCWSQCKVHHRCDLYDADKWLERAPPWILSGWPTQMLDSPDLSWPRSQNI